MNRFLIFLFLSAFFFWTSCTPEQNEAQFADLILHNGNFYTLDSLQPRAEAVAIRDGRILLSGSAEEAMELPRSWRRASS